LRKDYDVLITGGVDVTLDESPFVVFSAINALSPTGSYPFDSRANGFLDIVTICVPTPLDKNKQPDLTFIRNSAQEVASVCMPGC